MHSGALLAVLLLAPADAAPTSAAEYADRAEARYVDGDLQEAINLIQRAYRLDRRAEYLFMWAQAERSAGQCERALPLYREFLGRGEEFRAEDRARAMARATAAIEECEAQVSPGDEVAPSVILPPDEPEPEPEPEPELEPETTDPAITTEPTDTSERRRRADPLALALLTTGAVLTATGGVLGSIALYDRATAMQAEVEEDYARQVRREPALRWSGLGVLVVGAAVLGGGIARAVIVRRRSPRTAWWVSPAPAGLAVGGSLPSALGIAARRR